MLDNDLGTQLRDLVPSLDMPADPIAVLRPRIRRRRAGVAAVGAGGLSAVAIAGVAASVLLGNGATSVSPVTVASYPERVATAYRGAPLPQLHGASAWVIAHRTAGHKTLDILYFKQDDQSCIGSATTDMGTASPTPVVNLESQCGSLSGVSMNVPFGAFGEQGPDSILYGRAPAGTRLVRAALSGGSLAQIYYPAASVAGDGIDRFFAIDIDNGALHPLTGQLTFYNARGSAIGHEHIDIHALIHLPANSNCSSTAASASAHSASACVGTNSTN